MFEEGEWPREATPAPGPTPAPRAPAGARSPQRRQRLLATLRRLEGSARRPGGGSSSSASDSEAEAQPGGKRGRRGPAGRRVPGPPLAPFPLAGAVEGRGAAEGRAARGPGGALAGAGCGPLSRCPPARVSVSLPPSLCPGAAAAGGGAPTAGEQQESAGVPRGAPPQALTRKQWRNRQKNKKRQKNKFKAGEPSSCQPSPECPPRDLDSPAPPTPPPQKPPGSRAASLRLRMEERLDAARFRYLNQLLYTCPSQKAARLFQEDPESFAVYHRGFAQQVARWPESPVQRLVHYLRHRPASLVVADFGCGDCTLARSVRNKVHCFDLLALDPRVTVCDMAQVPLEAESVDVVVFCLALMGTNLCEILEEASRVLRIGGTLLVAEVASRFPDVRAFVGALAQLGFKLLAKDVSGSHFYTFELRKAAALPAGAQRRKPLPGLALRPCLYKRR